MSKAYVSYYDILNDRNRFRKSGGVSPESDSFDVPSHKFFKLFFHFWSDKNDPGGGLLAPSWYMIGERPPYSEEEKQSDEFPQMWAPFEKPETMTQEEGQQILKTQRYRTWVSACQQFQSAWSYLQLNSEVERAEMLQKFVMLLSNISSNSPWYFSELTGLESGMDRKMIGSEVFAIDPVRPKISIKCLPDAADNRIGTLLDLYRNITWDWVNKREVIPANLRKFDMGVLIFESPVEGLHVLKNLANDKALYKNVGLTQSIEDLVSYKYIELHNCEIEYNSTKLNYATLNNKDGVSPEYIIEISFDDCFETNFNSVLGLEFSELLDVPADSFGGNSWINRYNKIKSKYSVDTTPQWLSSNERELDQQSMTHINPGNPNTKYMDVKLDKDILKGYQGNSRRQGLLESALKQVYNYGKDYVVSTFKKAVLGNLYTFSLSNIGSQLKSLMSGNVVGSAQAIKNTIEETKRLQENNLGDLLDIRHQFNDIYDPLTGLNTGKVYRYNREFQTVETIGSLSGELVSEPYVLEKERIEHNISNASKFEYKDNIGQIMQDNTLEAKTQIKPIIGSMWSKKIIKPTVKKIGNLAQGNTIADNL